MGSRKNSNQKKNTTASKVNDITLIMESGSQPLNEAQLAAKNKLEEEYNQFMKKFSESISKKNCEIIEQGNLITVYEIDCTPNFPAPVIQKDISNVASSGSGLIKATPTSTLLATTQSNVSPLLSNNGVLLPNANVASSGSFTGQPTYQLLMSPRMGLLVTPSTPAAVNTIAPPTNVSSTSAITTVRPASASRVQVRPGLGNIVAQPAKRLTSSSAPVSSPKISINPATQKNTATLTKGPIPSSTSTINTRSKVKLTARQGETNASGTTPNISTKNTTNTNTVVDLTDDDSKSIADSKEVSFNRFPGKMFPSLVVVARPHLKTKEMTASMITAERTQLDTKVKGILTNSPTKFTEWLIQQGLVRSEQVCTLHVNVDMTPIKLKLGMYSDVSKFPYSGGYVWISDCCPQKFVSVFCNSIFEGAPHAPTILLKLMYHWACQTNVHNIISWVKVENLYIKNFFTNLRAVCTAAICEKFGKLGGSGKKIEVGVISLGTTSQNGSIRQVKVEVLGIMDPVSKYVRLRAIDPIQNAEKNHKLRFSRILESLELWVHKSTTIITDYTVDKGTLNDLGFHSVIQVQLNSSQSKESNQGIMDYLKRIIPRMFQNTLSLLSRSIIQQFLDELVWRERWGPISSRAFDNLILHLGEMTKLDTGDTLINRLKNITSNPFRDWCYKNWKTNAAVHAKKGETTDVDVSNKSAVISKNVTTRLKTAFSSTNIAKSNTQGTTKLGAKGNSTITLTIDDSSDETSNPVGTAELISTDIEEDNVSVSSNSSRRSRNRSSVNDENRTSVNGTLKISGDSQSNLKSLEIFYYGVLPPDVVVVNKLKKVDLNMKCFICGLTYNNNIQFMKHLAGHAQNEGAFTTDYQCRYCLKNFTSAYDLEDHLGSTHFPNKYNSMCLICAERLKNRSALITHMQNTHVELELPYNCTICKFRSSEHTKVIDHFYEIHEGGEKVQCPFCLKIVTFESGNKTKLTQNVNFFFNHLKRHQQKRKCPKCVLSFVNKNFLKEHLMKYHSSCIALPGIIRHQCTDLSTILMPMPSQTPMLSRKGRPILPQIPIFSSFILENNISYPDVPPSICLECKNEVLINQHFTSYLTCMKCMFSSCCKTVMNKHIEKLHETKNKRKQPPHKTIPLQNPLFCVCGYSSSCGNNMASHLVHCKRRVAYPNPERAAQYSVQMQSASFPALINLDDVEQDTNDASDKWLRAFVKASSSSDVEDNKFKRTAFSEKSPPRMLKELGLVRKESNSADDDNTGTKSPDVTAEKSKIVQTETDDDQQNQLIKSAKKYKNDNANEKKKVLTKNQNDSSSEEEYETEIQEIIDDNKNNNSENENEEFIKKATENSKQNLQNISKNNGTTSSNTKSSTPSPITEITTAAALIIEEKIDEVSVNESEIPEYDKNVENLVYNENNKKKDFESNTKRDESAEMETEEDLNPDDEKMDDEENTVAMDCEEMEKSNKMVIDTYPEQDAMLID